MKKRVISILLSAAMISSMVVAGGVTAHAEENVTLNVFDAHAYGLDEYDEMVKAFEESHPGVTVDVQHAANDYDTLLQSRVNSGDTPDVFDAEAGTKAKMYYDYAYDWSNDTEVLDKFNEDAVNLGKDDEGNEIPKTVISREYSSEWKPGDEPYYPVNDEKNGKLYAEYKKLAEAEQKVVFGGRLGEYKYYDMDAVIASALDMCKKELM